MRNIILVLVLLMLPAVLFAAEYRVGIVASEGSRFTAESIGSEIEDFVTGDDSTEIKIYIYSAQANLSKIDSIINRADAESDIVIYVGEVTAGRALLSKASKPSVAVFNTDAGCKGQFTYIIAPDINYSDDLASFKDLFGYEELKIYISEYANCRSDICRGSQKKILDSITVPYELLSGEDVPDKLEKGDTLLVLNQPQMKREELGALLNELAEKGVKTFSFGGADDAELGFTAVNTKDKDTMKKARSAAVAVLDIINGIPQSSVIRINRAKGMVINMRSASLAGFSPAWSYLRSAELINHEDSYHYDKYIGFEQAVREAVENNEDVALGYIELERANEIIKRASSAMRPSLTLSSSLNRIDDDRARLASGTSPEQTLDVAVGLQQIIYSEEVFSLKEQAKLSRDASESLARQAELDVMQVAAKAYLDVLRAQTYMRIARDNLNTTRYNYDLAKNRDLAGAANPAELHRWEARIALSKIDMINAENSLKNAMTELARILSEDIDGFYRLEELSLDDNYGFLKIRDKGGMLSNPAAFKKFKKIMTEKAVQNSVELKNLKYLIEAADRSVLTAKRKYTHPEVTLGGEYKRFLDKSGEGDDTGMSWYDDNEWNLGIKASIPLYEGGRRSADLSIEKTALRRLYHEKAKAVKLVRQRMITSLENARTAYDSYVLSGESAKASSRTLDIVADLYARGAVSITELIDAQNAKLQSDMNEASNLYSFMEKIVDVERAYGAFFSLMETPKKSEIINLLNKAENEGADE
jgi:outer membrane protein TolC